MLNLELKEGVTTAVKLDSTELASLLEIQLVEVVPLNSVGTYALTPAKNKVGVAVNGGVQVSVAPKIPVPQLVHLLDYHPTTQFFKKEHVSVDDNAELATVIIVSFTSRALSAVDRLLKGYQPVEDSLNVLRGRLNVPGQIAKHMGMPLPLEVKYEDYTPDIPENRLILKAVLVCLQVPRLSSHTTGQLRALRGRLEEMGVARTKNPSHWVASRLNQHYHDALKLAELILRGQSFSIGVGRTRTSGFVVDMWQVFEDYVVGYLAEYLPSRGFLARGQYGIRLDTKNAFSPRVDVAITDGTGRVTAMVDAKYKKLYGALPPISDIYQLHSYCIASGVSRGHLIYAGTSLDRCFPMSKSGVEIICHAVDLSLPTPLLTERMREVSDLIARGQVSDSIVLAD